MNNQGSEALFQASSSCKLRLVRMLVEGGTSVNVRNKCLETPLMLCCQAVTDIEEKLRVVNYLLGKKAKVNLQDIEGRTALIHASLSNSGKEIVKALLDAKANPWVQDDTKNTVFDYVINAGDLETTRLLINACRDNMLMGGQDNGLKDLEECLANIQEMRKVSWPLMGPRSRRNHLNVYATEKEEPHISCNNLLGTDLGSDNLSRSLQPERRRKRSVCHFDPLDIEEILNCNEEAERNTRNGGNESEDGKSEQRKTSVRSLSEEERFSFQISEGENAPREQSPGLEKLLKLQDSFSSSLDSNESPGIAQDSVDDTIRSPCVNQQVCEGSVKVNKGIHKIDEEENKESKNGSVIFYSGDKRHKHVNNDSEKAEKIRDKTTKEGERLFTPRISMGKGDICKSDSEFSTIIQTKAVIDSPKDADKTGLEFTEKGSNPYTALITSHQSSPLVSPLSSPRVTRRQTFGAGILKQSASPRASPVTVLSEQNRRETSIVRRYTLSAMDMEKFQRPGAPRTLLVPQLNNTSVEPGKRNGSAMTEPTIARAPGVSSSPPGLRKSKSDMTDWTSMSRNLQWKETVESARANGQSANQLSDQAKLEGNEIAQVQLPSISPASTKGRRSPKDFMYTLPVTTPTAENKQPNAEPRMEQTILPYRNNIDNDKRSIALSRTTLPSPQTELPATPSNSCEKSDVAAVATMADLSSKSLDKAPADVLPDLLLNCPPQEGHFARQGGISPTNINCRSFKDTTITSPNSPEERDASVSPLSQQRTSPRLRPGNLLPPLMITNRRSPTYEIEDGYFSGTPSPADVESPRRKYSNEQLRYSFKPISPRSPIPSPKTFPLQTVKPHSSH